MVFEYLLQAFQASVDLCEDGADGHLKLVSQFFEGQAAVVSEDDDVSVDVGQVVQGVLESVLLFVVGGVFDGAGSVVGEVCGDAVMVGVGLSVEAEGVGAAGASEVVAGEIGGDGEDPSFEAVVVMVSFHFFHEPDKEVLEEVVGVGGRCGEPEEVPVEPGAVDMGQVFKTGWLASLALLNRLIKLVVVHYIHSCLYNGCQRVIIAAIAGAVRQRSGCLGGFGCIFGSSSLWRWCGRGSASEGLGLLVLVVKWFTLLGGLLHFPSKRPCNQGFGHYNNDLLSNRR